jgi:outer membrane protein
VRNLKFAMVFIALISSSAVFAETKMAVVDLGKAIFLSDVAKKRVEQLKSKSEYAALQAKYDSTAADMQTRAKDAESKSMTWSSDQKAEFKKTMEYLRADLQLTGQKLDSEIKSLQNGIVQELQPKAQEALQELVKAEKIDLLLRADAVILVEPKLDITAKLTERLNKKTK